MTLILKLKGQGGAKKKKKKRALEALDSQMLQEVNVFVSRLTVMADTSPQIQIWIQAPPNSMI